MTFRHSIKIEKYQGYLQFDEVILPITFDHLKLIDDRVERLNNGFVLKATDRECTNILETLPELIKLNIESSGVRDWNELHKENKNFEKEMKLKFKKLNDIGKSNRVVVDDEGFIMATKKIKIKTKEPKIFENFYKKIKED